MISFSKNFRTLTALATIGAFGCGSSETHTPTEMHDQKGEHLSYPAGGPNSPDFKKAAAKGAPAEEKKEAAAEKK